MKNIVPNTFGGAMDLADLMEGGLVKLKVDLGMRYADVEVLRAKHAAFVAAQGDFIQSRLLLAEQQELMTTLTEQARQLAMVVREILKSTLGKRYSRVWDVTGYVNSLETPRSFAELMNLIGKLSRFLDQYSAEQDVVLHTMGAKTASLHVQMKAANLRMNSLQAKATGLQQTRDEAMRALRRYLRLVIDELHILLDPMDQRWKNFGLNLPGAKQTPEPPENVTAKVVNGKDAMIEFQRPARAEYFRVYQRVIGVDEAPVRVGSPADPNFTIENVPANVEIEVLVTAVNSGGESPCSTPVRIVT